MHEERSRPVIVDTEPWGMRVTLGGLPTDRLEFVLTHHGLLGGIRFQRFGLVDGAIVQLGMFDQ